MLCLEQELRSTTKEKLQIKYGISWLNVVSGSSPPSLRIQYKTRLSLVAGINPGRFGKCFFFFIEGLESVVEAMCQISDILPNKYRSRSPESCPRWMWKEKLYLTSKEFFLFNKN